MFDNISQGLVEAGAARYMVAVPVLRMAAALFMAFSTYKLLKVRQDNHKLIWILAIMWVPILARMIYEIYRRWVAPKDAPNAKGSSLLLILSIAAFVLSAVLSVVSAVSVGIGFIKSELDGEPIAIFYDVHGNEYTDRYDVPLHDKMGNVYTHEAEWFTAGTYTDQDGKTYDGEDCYLSQEGYFYFDANNELVPYLNYDHYYTDGETVYYSLFHRVHWEEDGTIWGFTGRMDIELFDFAD